MTKPADYGTNQLSKQHKVKPELTGRGLAVRMRVTDQTELDRLCLKGLINLIQHSAGESLCRDLHKAKMLGMATVNFTPSTRGGGGSISQSQADALCRVSDAMRALDAMVGEEPRTLVLNVCLSLVRPKDREEVALLAHGLNALTEIYQARGR